MRVLLVNTNRMKPAIAPIGLDYLADSLAAAGHETRLLDLCFSENVLADLESTVRDFSARVIGVSVRNTDDCYFSGGAFFLPEVREVICTLKKLTDAPVVLGGVGFSVTPEAVMNYCEADYGIAGEGELAFVEFLAAFEQGIGHENVPGLLWRVNGIIRRNPQRDADLGLLPPRTRSFVDNARYFREGGQAGFETKRGCNMDCIYCADPVSKGRRIRLLPPAAVVAELQALLSQGIDCFHTCDCEFNIPMEHAKAVCREIIRAGLGEKIRWYAYCSPAPFDDELAGLARRAGCAGIDFGADSGSNAMLARLGRHFSREDLVRTAGLCRAHGITFMYDLLLGGPGETRQTVRETIELMRQINADCVGLSMGVRVYEGTPLARSVRESGTAASSAAIHGAKDDNPGFLRPVFYVSPELGTELVDYVRGLVGSDERFFLPCAEPAESNYNYSDNKLLVDAIAEGARGAYWDILRRMRPRTQPHQPHNHAEKRTQTP